MKVFKFLYNNLDHFRLRFWLCFLIALIDGAVVFTIPLLLSEATKVELNSLKLERVIIYLIFCFATSIALQWTIRRYGESLGYQYGNHLREKYFQKILKLNVKTLIKNHTGYILSQVNKVSDSSRDLVLSSLWLVAHSLATFILFFVFTARESLIVAFFDIGILLLFVCISYILSRKMVPIAKKLNTLHASLIETFIDFSTNISTIRKLRIENFATVRMSLITSKNYFQIKKLQNFHSNRWLILHSIFGVAYIATLIFLLKQINLTHRSPSILILFIGTFSIIRSQVERSSELIKNCLELDTYIDSLTSITNQITSISKSEVLTEWEKLEVKDLKFRYDENNNEINIPNFIINKTDKISIQGESGQGKSTFVNILGNFLKPATGDFLVDEEILSSNEYSLFSSKICIISQEVELFNISIRDNITLGAELEDQQIIEVLFGLNLKSWYEKLPDGLDTIAGEKGVTLSSGQKQRLNIARGLLLRKDITIFDEPTSNLDEHTEDLVISFINIFIENKTAIFVTHKNKILSICKSNYLFKNSKLLKL